MAHPSPYRMRRLDRVMHYGDAPRTEAEVRAMRDVNDLRDESRHEAANAAMALAEAPEVDALIEKARVLRFEARVLADRLCALSDAVGTFGDDLSDAIGTLGNEINRAIADAPQMGRE